MTLKAIDIPPSPMNKARASILAGVVILGVGFGGVGAWAALAPLASASIATGSVAVSGSRQTVQHLEGGIIQELLVREGAQVEAGDVLIRLDATRAQATYDLIRGQYLAALGEQARLIAERDGDAAVTFPDELLTSADDPDIGRIIKGQTNVFESRRTYLAGQREILEQRKTQYEQEIAALDAQQRAEKRQLDLIAEETRGVEELVNKGLEKRPRLLALQRAAASIEGSRGEHMGMIARARQAITELDAQLMDIQNKMMAEVVAQLRETEARIFDLAQRMRATQDVLERINIRAPRPGYVVNLQYHTVGGVIQPGSPILDIVPTDAKLIIEAKLSPNDIDVLQVGMPAEISLSAYNRRSVPTIEGTLIMISADRLIDQATNQPYYLGRVEVDRTRLAELENVNLVPGMPVEVMVRTGERTALRYALDPILKSLNRAARED